MFLKQRFSFFLIAIALFLPHYAAFAGSCCAGGGGQSLCVLPSEQRYQLGIAESYRSISGEFDPYGNYTAKAPGDSSTYMSTVIGASYRIADDWQAGVSLPIVQSFETFSGTSHKSTVLGDPAVEGRYTVWDDLGFLKYRPQLSIYGGARLPLGANVYNSTSNYDTNVLGDGTTVPYLGVNASKLYHPIKVTFDGSYLYPLSKHVTQMHGAAVAPYDLKIGNRIQASEALSYLFSEAWSATVGMKQMWQSEAVMNGSNVSGSAARLVTTIAGISYFPNLNWSIAANFETPYPFYAYAANQAYFHSMSVAATYGGF